ncbi:hypothetical protein D3C87_1904460 [compost metagenome]
MAIAVVDGFEVVDVDNHHAKRLQLLLAAQYGTNGLFQRTAIGHTGQGICF